MTNPKRQSLSFIFILFLSFFALDKALSKGPIVIEKTLTQKTEVDETKYVKILAIDGGGIRGIIPAIILKEIESRLKHKKHLSQCFDVMSGTSTGGIIVLLLSTPNETNTPKFYADDIVNLYRNLGPEVFYRSLWRRIITIDGWLMEKYSQQNLAKNMEKYFSRTQLKDTLTEILIPAYDISKDQTILFKTSYAKRDMSRNFYLKDIARATSAAPTYFKPISIKDLAEKNVLTLMDGGIAINNPSLIASIHALKEFSNYNNFLIISIGTGTNYGAKEGTLSFNQKTIESGGKIAWVDDIIPVLLHAGNDIVDYLLQNAFVPNKIKKYYRLQVMLDPKHSSLDDTSKNNIEALETYARDLIEKHQTEINHIVKILDSN